MNSWSFDIIAPPSPADIFLDVWKLKIPPSPKAPTFVPSHSAPWACAASSITEIPYFLEISNILLIWAGFPVIWTGIMTFVLSVIASSILSGSILQVFGSISTKMGTALAINTAEAVAIKVYGGIITSSPALTPADFNATHRAVVPELVLIQNFESWKFENSFSNELIASLPTPQFSFSTVPIIASFSSVVAFGHLVNGFSRTGLPPWIASLDIY